jgi:hypothetical protein
LSALGHRHAATSPDFDQNTTAFLSTGERHLNPNSLRLEPPLTVVLLSWSRMTTLEPYRTAGVPQPTLPLTTILDECLLQDFFGQMALPPHLPLAPLMMQLPSMPPSATRASSPPQNAATHRCHRPPPSTHYFSEPSSMQLCPVGSPPRSGAHRDDLVAQEPPTSSTQPRHRGGRGRGAHAELPGRPSQNSCWAGTTVLGLGPNSSPTLYTAFSGFLFLFKFQTFP